MSNKQGRRHFGAEEKVRFLKRHLVDKEPVSAICEEISIQPSQFYLWQKEFFERGAVAFERSRQTGKRESTSERRIVELEAKIVKKNEVLGEIMEELVKVKKVLG